MRNTTADIKTKAPRPAPTPIATQLGELLDSPSPLPVPEFEPLVPKEVGKPEAPELVPVEVGVEVAELKPKTCLVLDGETYVARSLMTTGWPISKTSLALLQQLLVAEERQQYVDPPHEARTSQLFELTISPSLHQQTIQCQPLGKRGERETYLRDKD
jgi:hypothetical protein